LFKGDVNHLQRFALQEIITEEFKRDQAKEANRFRVQAAIAFPESAQKILSSNKEDDWENDVKDIEEYNPEDPGFSDEGIEKMLQVLEDYGFYSEELEE
jgi:hypothetical protein